MVSFQCKTKKSRRARKRAERNKLANAGLLAPLLAAEGCLSVGKKEVPLAAADAEPSGPRPPAANTQTNIGDNVFDGLSAQDDHFHTEVGEAIQIAPSQLQANDLHDHTGSLQVVRVFDAMHGTVTFQNGIVTFTPHHGFEGIASFQI